MTNKHRIKILTDKGEFDDTVLDKGYDWVVDNKYDKTLCLFWSFRLEQVSYLINEDKKGLCKEFKRFVEGDCMIITKTDKPEEGHKTEDNKTWYGLGFCGENMNFCPMSMIKFGFYNTGYMYWFKNKKNRDLLYEYCIKKGGKTKK